MGWKNRLVERGKQMAMTPRVLRVLSDDRVMRATEGVMDARARMRGAAQKAGEAWQLLVQGHGLPSIDPSIADDIDLPKARVTIESGENGSATNGNGHSDVVEVAKVNGGAHANGHATESNGAAKAELAASMASRTSLS